MNTPITLARRPIHSVLVGFPLAFYTVTLACFFARAVGAESFWFRVGVYANVVGIAMAVMAAIPGSIDLAFHVPPHSSAKSTGVTHMVWNLVGMALFALNVTFSWRHRLAVNPDTGSTLILSTAGMLATVVGWYFGWKLVNVHRIGYAGIGREDRDVRPGPDFDA
jgi:uncharacterized membrane protein